MRKSKHRKVPKASAGLKVMLWFALPKVALMIWGLSVVFSEEPSGWIRVIVLVPLFFWMLSGMEKSVSAYASRPRRSPKKGGRKPDDHGMVVFR